MRSLATHRLTFRISFVCLCLLLFISCGKQRDWPKETRRVLSAQVLEEAKQALSQEPETITSYPCEQSVGGLHDYYSESDYWWPDPADPEGPYIQLDGENNPELFNLHRRVLIRFSRIVGTLASAYVITGDDNYAAQAMRHIREWFIDPQTRMNPNMLYAQAIHGITHGRRTGIVDAIQLIEVAQGIYRIKDSPAVDPKELNGIRKWFSEYLRWVSTHPYGIDAMNTGNNHAFCWILQVAVFARLTENSERLEFCRQRMKNVLLSQQLEVDGRFPAELARNKAYACSLFTLDVVSAVCQVLSTPQDDLWRYETHDGKSVRRALDFHVPYIRDKSSWPYPPDINYFDLWPVAQNALLFGAAAYEKNEWFDLWRQLPQQIPSGGEVERNFPIRNPLIWL